MLTVHCPTCNSALGLGEEMAGQQVRCGGCQEVFIAEAPPPRRSRRDEEDEEDRPRKRPARRDDDDDRDRPRRSRRRDDYDDDDYDDEPRRRKQKKRKKVAPGKPGLAVAASILFLIWGGLGAIFTIYHIIMLVRLLDLGAPFTIIMGSLVGVILRGVFCGYLISSGLTILNGQAESIASIGIAVLSICVALMILAVVSVAMIMPVFAAELALIAVVWVLVLTSGVIVGGIFCLVCNGKYEKWQAS